MKWSPFRSFSHSAPRGCGTANRPSAAEEYAGRAPRSAASLLPFREVTEVGATGEGYIALATDSECK